MKANAKQDEVVPLALNLTAQQLFSVGYGQDYCLLGDRFEDYDTFEDILEDWALGNTIVFSTWFLFRVANMLLLHGE